MHLYMQLAVALAPVIIATFALLSLAMARAQPAQPYPGQQQQQPFQQHGLAAVGAPEQPPLPPPVDSHAPAASSPNGAASSSGASASASAPEPAPVSASSSASSSTSAASPAVAASAGAAIPAGHSISLRFLHGEKALLTHVCDRTAPVHQLKRDLYPLLIAPGAGAGAGNEANGAASAASVATTPPPRIMLIFQGTLLRDERTLADYPAITPGDIVHVHAIHADPPPTGAAAGAAELRHRGPHVAAGGAPAAGAALPFAPQGEILLPPRGGAQFANVGMVGPGGQVQANHLWRAMSVLMVAALGALWGMVLVWGSQLFTLNSLLCLMFLSGIAAVGVIQAIAT